MKNGMKEADAIRGKKKIHINGVKISISNAYNLIVRELSHDKIYKFDKYLNCCNEEL